MPRSTALGGRAPRRTAFACAAVAAALSWPFAAWGFSGGITTNQFPNLALGCNNCHSGGTHTPTVSLSGPALVAPGAAQTYTLQLTNSASQNKGGLNVSAPDGTFSVGGADSANTQTMLNNASGLLELTHTGPKAAVSGTTTFSFDWTAPGSAGSVTLTGWGNAVNGTGNNSGDKAASTTLAITVSSADGAAGTSGSQCASGNCVDGVCCNVASCPAGEACSVAGQEGQCAPLPPTSTPTIAPSSTPTRTPTSTATATPTRTPTRTPTSSVTATPTRTPTQTPTPTSTATPTSTPTDTHTPTPSSTVTETPTVTATPTLTETPTETRTATETSTSTATPTGPMPTPTSTQTPTATGTETATGTVTPTETATTFPTPTPTPPPGICDPAPRAGCLVPGKSSLKIVDRSDDAKDSIRFQWSKGPPVAFADFPDPVSTANYALCVYENSALIMRVDAPRGGTCDVKPCWVVKGAAPNQKGYLYKDKPGSPSGMLLLKLQKGAAGKSKLQAKGKGLPLQDPAALPVMGAPVAVQVVNDVNSNCWGDAYSGSDVVVDDGVKFGAKVVH